MIFDDIPDGESVFIDANTFVYHFTPHPRFGAACRTLFNRILQQQVAGFTAADFIFARFVRFVDPCFALLPPEPCLLNPAS